MRIDFQGRGKVEAFSRACVQAMGDGIQLALRVARQVHALRQVLAQQPIRVLVGAALPGAIRTGKEDPDRQPLGQACVLGHLFPPIVRQGFAQQRELNAIALNTRPRKCLDFATPLEVYAQLRHHSPVALGT